MELCKCSVPNRELQVIGQHHRCSVGRAVFYVERTHYIGIRTFPCNVKREISSSMSGWNGLAMSWLWKSGRSSRIDPATICFWVRVQSAMMLAKMWTKETTDWVEKFQIVFFLHNQLVKWVLWPMKVAPPEFDAFHVLKARSHIFSLTFRHKRTSQMHQCVFVFPFSNRELLRVQ